MGSKGSGRTSGDVHIQSEGQRLALNFEKRHGLRQAQAAARLGLSAINWNRYRSAQRRPAGNIAVQIQEMSGGEIDAGSWWVAPKAP